MRSVEAAGAACAAGTAVADVGTGASAGAAGFVAVGTGAGAAGAGFAAGTDDAGACAAAGAEATADPAPSITATIVWMGTVCPSGTLISFSTPAEGEGISASTLSVEISNSGSSRSTLSPGFFSHLVMVPSKMLSPIWGMTTSTGIAVISLLAEKNCRPRRFWPVNSPTFVVYRESHRNKNTCPPGNCREAGVAKGSMTRPAPHVVAIITASAGKRGRRERVRLRF